MRWQRRYVEAVTDPEETVQLRPADLAEVAVDEIDDLERPIPIEADEADAIEQKLVVEDNEDYLDEQ
jgi:hypothetical protein